MAEILFLQSIARCYLLGEVAFTRKSNLAVDLLCTLCLWFHSFRGNVDSVYTEQTHSLLRKLWVSENIYEDMMRGQIIWIQLWNRENKHYHHGPCVQLIGEFYLNHLLYYFFICAYYINSEILKMANLPSLGFGNIDDRHRHPNINIREIIWLGD